MKMMRGIAALAAAFILSGSAIAADVPASAPQYRYQQQTVKVFDWTGFYAGIDVGYTDSGYAHTLGLGITLKSNGASIGASAKYLWQNGNFVFGPELSARWYFADGELPLLGITIEDKYSIGTSAIVGYALTQRFVPYGHVGYQWKRSEFAVAGFGTSKLSMNSLTYGAGAMWALNDRLSLDLRWTRSDGDDNAFGVIGLDSKEDRVTFGANFKFSS